MSKVFRGAANGKNMRFVSQFINATCRPGAARSGSEYACSLAGRAGGGFVSLARSISFLSASSHVIRSVFFFGCLGPRFFRELFRAIGVLPNIHSRDLGLYVPLYGTAIIEVSRRGLGDRRGDSLDRVGGKSGHRRTGWWITSTGREARESATESKQPGEPSAISLQPSARIKADG
jgi:hypothetical protein